MRCSIRVLALTTLLVIALPLSAQDDIRDPALERAKISPTLYFPSGAAEAVSRQELHNRVPATIAALKDARKKSLVAKLDAAWKVYSDLQRHDAYLRVKGLEDSQDDSVVAARNGVNTDQSIVEAAIYARLQHIPAADRKWIGPYAALATDLHSADNPSVSPGAVLYRSSVTLPHEQAIGDAYDRLINAMPTFKDLTAEDVGRRRAAISQEEHAYEEIAPAAAALLGALVDSENRDAVAQGFLNAADQKYQSLGLSGAQVDTLLSSFSADAHVYKEYQEITSKHAAAVLGLSSILSREQALATQKEPHLSFADGSELILKALKPLGPDYVHRFAALLDPENGRLDLSGGAHRAHTGTSIAVFDAPVAFYYTGYQGTFENLRTVVHEGGHAIHREFMNDSGIPVYQREGPHYMFEGFAIFNELLLLDYEVQHAPTPTAHANALERLLARLAHEVFVSAEETRFEQTLYKRSLNHGLLDRSEIDSIYKESIAPYEYWPLDDVGSSRLWIGKALLFEDPLYLVNYLYASLVAVALFERAESDPNFAAKYTALLKRGFDEDPEALLATMGIRLNDPSLVNRVAELFHSKSLELQNAYLSTSDAL